MGRQSESAEALLARAAAKGYKRGYHHEKDSIRKRPQYVEKTLRDQNIALKLYEKSVLSIILETVIMFTIVRRWMSITTKGEGTTSTAYSLQEGCPPPDLVSIKDFLRFHVAISKGNIDKKGRITTDSLNTFAEWFFAGFARVTGNIIEEEDRCAVYHVRLTVLRYGSFLTSISGQGPFWWKKIWFPQRKNQSTYLARSNGSSLPIHSGQRMIRCSSTRATKHRFHLHWLSSVGLGQESALSFPNPRMTIKRVCDIG